MEYIGTGTRIKLERIRRNLLQADVATLAHTNKVTVHRAERGAYVSESVLGRILRVLEIADEF